MESRFYFLFSRWGNRLTEVKLICLKSLVGCWPKPAFTSLGHFSVCFRASVSSLWPTCSPLWSTRGKLGEILEWPLLLPVLSPQPQSHLGFTFWVLLFGPLLYIHISLSSCSSLQREALGLGGLDSLLSSDLATSLNLSQPLSAIIGAYLVRTTWGYMEIGE